jgi:murein DD-endopeptidase MepM/ murein hydrolase activator NlpD
MVFRAPSTQPLANTSAQFAFVVRRGGTWSVVDIGGWALGAIVAFALLLLVGATIGSFYNMFRDEAVQAIVAGEKRDLRAYEERIAELRSRIDRMTTRQIVNQDTIEDRVAELVARQAELEARYLLVSDLEARANMAGLSGAREPVTTSFGAPSPLKAPAFEARFPLPAAMGGPGDRSRDFSRPVPLDNPPNPVAPSAFQPVAPQSGPQPFEELKMRGAIKDVVGQIDRRTRIMEDAQIETMRQLAEGASRASEQDRKVIAATGLPLSRFGKAELAGAASVPSPVFALRDVSRTPSSENAMGGPLLPPHAQSASRFEDMLIRADRAIVQASLTRHVTGRLPLSRPLSPEHDITSSFGTRIDPFTRGLAMHSGIDFRAPTGTPVRATAPGKVIEAGTNGGYGRMIEIDHGHGISTRYAHLSSIAVNEGDTIRKGQIIGAVGSTGRSTGPHLHYEIRIDEDASDPMRFLRAQRLARD